MVVVGVSYGLGAHVEFVSEENRHKALIYKWAGQTAYIIVSTLVKFVVGIFLLRLCVNNNWQRRTIQVLLAIVGVFNLFYVFVCIFQCQPIAYYWWRYTPVDESPVTGKCNGKVLATVPTYFAVLIGIVADITLALLPATLIKGANLNKSTKISVCCVLALGSLASVATIARIPYAKQLLSNPDYLYNFTDLAIWSIAECGIAITASSLATLRPLCVKMRLLATTHFTSRYGYGSAGLPMQSATHVTIISSAKANNSSKRNTAMTGGTAMSGSTARTGTTGLTCLKEGQEMEGGIQVEKEFEMSIITRNTSQDSIDILEAEVNEVIRPGTAKRKPSYDDFHKKAGSRSGSFNSRPRPPTLQTNNFRFDAPPSISPQNSVPSPTSARFMGRSSNPSSPSGRRPSAGTACFMKQDPNSASPLSAQMPRSTFGEIAAATYSSNTAAMLMQSPPPPQPVFMEQTPRSPSRSTHSSRSFHLPIRLQNPHQSMASNASGDIVVNENRGTFGASPSGSPAPLYPSEQQQLDESYFNRINEQQQQEQRQPLGPPVSFRNTRQGSQSSGSASPTTTTSSSQRGSGSVRFPFQKATTIRESFSKPPQAAKTKSKKPRVSAFLSDDSSLSSRGDDDDGRPDEHHDLPEEIQAPHWPPPSKEIPSPLRSHPPLPSRGSDWV